LYDSAVQEHKRSEVAEREDEERKREMHCDGRGRGRRSELENGAIGTGEGGQYKGELASPHHPASHDPVTIAADP
jgi:hypothetical protein